MSEILGRIAGFELVGLPSLPVWMAGAVAALLLVACVFAFSRAGRTDRIRVPTLILAGDRDPFVSRHKLAQLHEGIAHSELVHLPGCGHLAFVAQAERVAEEARKFLNCDVVAA